MLKFGFAKEIITPKRGISLCGYFNPRPNTGVYDDISVKVLAVEQDSVRSAIVSFDLCFITSELTERICTQLSNEGIQDSDKILFAATHTHTGPNPSPFFSTPSDPDYLDGLVQKTVTAIREAFQNLQDGEIFYTKTSCTEFAFNRRYFMKDGKVLTNPGKLNAAIVKPEGPVDYEIPVLAVKQNGMITALLVNIVNHTDTIGGNLVSADWPGRMEHFIQSELGYDIPVITVVGCSGNINHFDVAWNDPQTSYDEAKRIGKGYAKVVLKAIPDLKKLSAAELKVDSCIFELPAVAITEEECVKAREILEKADNSASSEDLTSEGLAKGDGAVARFFAKQLLKFKEDESGKTRCFPLISIKFGKEICLVSLPGEPFVEVGLSIKQASHFPLTLPISNAMGKAGYIPMPECFSRGGYEILPVSSGGCRHDTAPRMTDAAIRLINC